MLKLLNTKFSPFSYYCLPLRHEHLPPSPPPPPPTTTTTPVAAAAAATTMT